MSDQIQIIVADDGEVCVLHPYQFEHAPKWAQFDPKTAELHLIFAAGEVMLLCQVYCEDALSYIPGQDHILCVAFDKYDQPVSEAILPLQILVDVHG